MSKKSILTKLFEQELKPSLPFEIENRASLYPENRKRIHNQKIYDDEFFEIVYDLENQNLLVEKKKQTIYSLIPYDTCRKYIQRATIFYLLSNEKAREFTLMNKENILQYIKVGYNQKWNKKINKNELEVEFDKILNDPYFEIQVIGRLLQHYDTGPLSASLDRKFLYDDFLDTGIKEYINSFIKFMFNASYELNFASDGVKIHLINSSLDQYLEYQEPLLISYNSVVKGRKISSKIPINNPKSLEVVNQMMALSNSNWSPSPLSNAKYDIQRKSDRKNYVAHSIRPWHIKHHELFENKAFTHNNNMINVVSDIHITNQKFPFTNDNFNIFAGDIIDNKVYNPDIKGICVIGNHELTSLILNESDKWEKYEKEKWFDLLRINPDASWSYLPVGDHPFYQDIKEEMEKSFPNMFILNNEAIIHNGIRYVGLTIPVELNHRKNEVHKFVATQLKHLLKNKKDTPTIIISHAPICNELNKLSKTSRSYKEEYFCENHDLINIFKEYNILGVIHGHHHIPASHGSSKWVNFANKEMFVICSIYNEMNTGIELLDFIPNYFITSHCEYPPKKIIEPNNQIDNEFFELDSATINNKKENIEDVYKLLRIGADAERAFDKKMKELSKQRAQELNKNKFIESHIKQSLDKNYGYLKNDDKQRITNPIDEYKKPKNTYLIEEKNKSTPIKKESWFKRLKNKFKRKLSKKN